MKKISGILSIIFICSLIFSSNIFASTSMKIYVPSKQIWNWVSSETRTGNYSTTNARTYAVYPYNGGYDNFTRVQVQVTSTGGRTMSDIVTLYETASSSTSIKLKEGMLSNKNILFKFRGNHPNYSAWADVYYNAR